MKLALFKAVNYLYIGAGAYRRAIADFFLRTTTIVYLSLAVFINICTWFLAIVLNHSLADNLAILHYNVIFGIDRIGAPHSLLTLPLTGLVLTAFNFFLAALLVRKQHVAPGHHLLVTAIIGNLLLLVATYLIYAINFS